ncbi:uncharacterized protein LOC120005936 [Tripterygium wilfordii]|uniref:uncharacterized protein LOC120005936 n=1 Tax=Tripterygium wilfordii TaxID=458696 RepID=UPI0018F7F0A9|nr:uncharacterized protein LOC120005936 [Tripterygium wilfordii]
MKVFNSRKSLIEWVQNTGRNLGFVIVIKRSEIGGFGRRHKFLLKCDRGGTYNSKKTSTRLTGTKKRDCPFRAKGMKLNTYDDWMVRVLCGVHNHFAALYIEDHSYVGKHAFPNVLLMHATCKTNRFRMILFEIVGVTSSKLTFCVGFVFLQSEKEGNYTWTLNCLRSTMDESTFPRVIVTDRYLALMRSCAQVFPESMKLLCRWHIDRAVIAHCKKSFRDKESWDSFYSMWHILMESETDNAYVHNLSALEIILQNYSKVKNYIKDVWLMLYKEMFISAWTDTYMHFGNLTTNKAESQHSKLKLYLGTPQSDLESAVSSIHQLIQVIYSCGCKLRMSNRLPCAHELAIYTNEDCPIPIACIDKFWKKLDLLPSVSPVNDDIDCSVEQQMFAEQFKRQSKPDKVSLLRKLREIINPSITSLFEPVVKTNISGCPSSKKKIDKSTCCNQYAFDFVQHDLNHSQDPVRHSSSSIRPSANRKVDRSISNYASAFEFVQQEDLCYSQELGRHSCSSIYSTPPLPTQRISRSRSTAYEHVYLSQFPPILQPYIMFVKDVRADGNCGFRLLLDYLVLERMHG